jgi:hypothetical protein
MRHANAERSKENDCVANGMICYGVETQEGA